ncbi:MAG: phytanoyl-CoA dioxygenase family protein, partial [Candidatus Sericytochromatia bacterium]
HQDDTIIDISEPFSAFTCWIPLEDVSYSNGCMGLIKGGHLLFNNICANPADYAQNIKQEYIPILSKYMNWLEIKAGKTIIVNHNTPHASLPNFSKKNRLAIALLMTDSRATLCNYFKNPKKENSILKYKVNKDFFINYSNERLLNLYNNNCLIEEYPISEELECNQQDMNLSFLENKLFEYGNMPNNKYELYLKYKNSSSNKILYKIKNLFRRISNATAT